MIAPDARDGKSTVDVLEKLRLIAAGETRCDEYVFILDTLKKFVDVIDKRQAKEIYKLFRTLSVKGGALSGLIENQRRAIETHELEQRLNAIEEKLGAKP